MLTLPRASKHRPGGWSDDGYDVVDDEGPVGLIVLTAASFTAGRDKPWFWSITCTVTSETADRGNAATREEAMQAFKARWLVVSASGSCPAWSVGFNGSCSLRMRDCRRRFRAGLASISPYQIS